MTISIFELFSNKLSHSTIDRDNWYFKLFSRWTVAFLLLMSAFSFATSYSDRAITCKARNDKDYFETYCWSNGKVIPIEHNPYISNDDDSEILCGGINDHKESDESLNHSPHLWVTLMLLVQGAIFMIPDILWRGIEGGMLDQFGTEKCNFLALQNENGKTFNGLSKKKTHVYFISFVFCECLNVVITIINFILTNIFLGGHFYNRMISCKEFIFPTRFNCLVYSFTGSGGSQREDALCFLGQNIINQQLYLVLWGWFILLFAASGCMVIFRILCIALPHFRKLVLQSYTTGKGVEKIASIRVDSQAYYFQNIGHWFLLIQIGRNSSPYHFTSFLKELNLNKKVKDEYESLEMKDNDESRKLC